MSIRPVGLVVNILEKVFFQGTSTDKNRNIFSKKSILHVL